jgi:site-specific recombinase XerD
MNTPCFKSVLAARMLKFLSFKRMQGYDYVEGCMNLARFDAFMANRSCPASVLRREDLDAYCTELSRIPVATQAKLLSTVRQFSRYLRAFETESALLAERLLPRQPSRIRFYPLNAAQVGSLMAATAILRPQGGILPSCVSFLIGLLYSTGLRLGEALALNLGDVDMKDATLFVRNGKWHKQRLVVMGDSTCEALRSWVTLRSAHAESQANDPLLLGQWNQRLKHGQAQHAFTRLCEQCGISGSPPPRLHDLRHNFACGCLQLWREQQEDLDALLPVLANAMGHVDFRSTQHYMHIDAAALQRAGAKLHTHVFSTQG